MKHKVTYRKYYFVENFKRYTKAFLLNNREHLWGFFLYQFSSGIVRLLCSVICNIKAFSDALRIKGEIRECRHQGAQIIYLFGAPNHSNLGDNAQTVCIHDWIRQNYPNSRLFIFNFVKNNIYFTILKSSIKKEDLIFLHSGYHITEMYPLFSHVYSKIFQYFPENRIFFFPQTVNIATQDMAETVREIFSTRHRLVVAARDAQSHKFISSYFENSPQRLLLMPDVVTTMIGRYTPKAAGKRDGILCCLRNDKEKLWTTEQIIAALPRNIVNIKITDTTIKEYVPVDIEAKRKVITDMIDYFSQFHVIVTDRYHGTIFSLIANTPVIVIDSSDHKLSSGVNWFSDPAFQGRIFYSRTLDELKTIITKIISSPELAPPPAIFYEKYYLNLKDTIDNIFR